MRPEAGASPRIARFGVFEVDLERGEVRREGRRLSLQRHSFLVLAALLEHPGQEVSRETLRHRLWPGLDFLDFENGINTAVARLRQALGDSAETPRFVGTRRGYGYRLLLPVVWVDSGRGPETPLPGGSAPAGELPAVRSEATRWSGVPWSRLVAGAVVVTGLVGAALLSSRSHMPADRGASLAVPDTPGDNGISVHAPPGQNLSGSFALSPNGQMLAFVAGAGTSHQSRLWLSALDGTSAHSLAGTEDAAMPFWSPDGGSVGFFADGDLRTINLRNGRIAVVAPAARGRGGAWSAEGVILFAPDVDSGIFAVPAGGGRPVAATSPSGAESHRFPCFLPDGLHFLYLVLREDRDQSEVRWGRLGGPESGGVLTAGSNAVYVPPGYLVFARGGTLLAQAFDAGTLHATGPQVVLSDRVGVYGEEGPTGLGAFSASASGTLATTDVLRPPLRFSWFDRLGHRIDTTGPAGDYVSFDLSSDDNLVAAARYDSRKRSSDVITIDLRSGVQTQITDDPWPDAAVAWSPVGRRLAFVSLRAGGWAAVVKNISRGDDEQQFGNCVTLDGWFPDGRHLLCERSAERGTTLWKLPLASPDGAVPVAAAAGVDAQARVSPDGRWLAYVGEGAAGQPEVRATGLPPSIESQVLSLGPATSPRWRHDSRELYFLIGRTLVAIPVDARAPMPFGKPVSLFDATLPPHDSLADFPVEFCVSADGTRFLFAVPSETEPPSVINVVRWPKTASRSRI